MYHRRRYTDMGTIGGAILYWYHRWRCAVIGTIGGAVLILVPQVALY